MINKDFQLHCCILIPVHVSIIITFQKTSLLVVVLCLVLLSQDVLGSHQSHHSRYRRGILGKWFGTESNAVVQPAAIRNYNQQVQRVHTVNQQVPHYPIWKVHKYNGIDIKPMPVSMVPKYHHSANVRNGPITTVVHQQQQPIVRQERVQVPSLKSHPIAVAPINNPTTTTTSKTEDDIKGIMKLLGISDPSRVPSIQEVMDMLGASTQEEAIDTVKEIAATDEGIDLIKSFIESRQTPDDDEDAIIEVITQPPTTTTTTTTSTTTTTTLPPPTVAPPSPAVINHEKPIHPFWSPKNILSSAGAKVASRLDNLHTNTHLLGKIVESHTPPAAEGSSAFRNTLRNLRNFFTFDDNTPVALESYNVKEKPKQLLQQVTVPASPSVVYVNEPIPAAPINLPALPKLSPLPSLSGIRNIPPMPRMPQIQLPSHFSIPQNVVQGPYMKVKYPVASLAPQQMYRPQYQQRPLYSYRGQPISSAPTGTVRSPSSYEVPLYGPPIQRSQQRIPFSQSTRDAFQNAPQIISSLPVPSLPYTFEEEPAKQEQFDVDDQYFVAANSPIEAVVALPEDAIEESQQLTAIDNNERRRATEMDKDEQEGEEQQQQQGEQVNAGPQRLSGFNEAYATGKVHRATNVDIVQSRLTNGDTSNNTADEGVTDLGGGVVAVGE